MSRPHQIGQFSYLRLGAPSVVNVRSLRQVHDVAAPAVERDGGESDNAEKGSAGPDQTATGRQNGVIVMRQGSLTRTAAPPGTEAGANRPATAPTSSYNWDAGGYVEEAAHTYGSYPPDTQIAVGPASGGGEYVVEFLNSMGFFYNQLGVPLSVPRMDLNSFFGVNATYPSETDARVLYDPASGRFFASAELFNGSTLNSEVVVAVSQTGDPTGAWYHYSVASNTSGIKYDQPKLSVTSDKIVLSWTDYSGNNPTGTEFLALQKSDALSGVQPAAGGFSSATAWPGLVAAQELQSVPEAYLVYANGNKFGTIWITGTPGSKNDVAYEADTTLTATWNKAFFAQQPGSSAGSSPSIDANQYTQVQSAVWDNGIIWATGNDTCISSGVRVCLRAVQTSISGGASTLLQDQDLSGGDTSLLDPAVMLDGNNNVFLTFTETSGSIYPTAAMAVVPGGALGPDITYTPYAAGEHTYNDGTGAPSSRWGDYSGAAPDPLNPARVWLAAEFGAVSTSDNSPDWLTNIGAFVYTDTAVTGLSPASAPELSSSCSPTVTINGANFDSSATVNFGAVASGPVTLVSPTQLQVTAPPEARGTVDVTVTTNGGGTSPTSAADQFTYNPDTAPPTTTVGLSPTPNASGWQNASTTVTLTGTDDTCGSGVNATYDTVDGGTQQQYNGPFVIGSEGRHTLTYYSTDRAGNSETPNSLPVNIDLTPPHTTATLSGMKSGSSYVGTAQVALSATDPKLADGSAGSGVAATHFTLDGGASHTYTGTITVSGPGTHTITYASTDAAGNTEATGSISFTIVNGAAIYSGWNLIDVPVQGIGTASGLLTSLNGNLGSGAIKMVATYGNGRFSLYVPGFSSDQTLSPAQGVFVLSNVTGPWTPSGSVYTTTHTVSLQHGWTLAGAPVPTAGLDASTIVSEASTCGVQEVAIYSGGAYQTFVAGGSGSLHVPSDSGMWILCASAGSWTPS